MLFMYTLVGKTMPLPLQSNSHDLHCLIEKFVSSWVPEVFFCRKERREKREEEERSGERKHLVAGDVNLTIMLQLVSINITRSMKKQPITAHLPVNNTQSK